MVGQTYVQPLVKLLFERDRQHIADRLNELIEGNFARGNPKEGFLYGGKFHTTLASNLQRMAPKKMLHPDLREEAQDYLKEISQVEAEEQRVSHGLGVALRPCMDRQDVRDVLPDVVAKVHPDLAQLSRVRDIGWPFRDQSLHMHQFEEICDILEYYASNRIL